MGEVRQIYRNLLRAVRQRISPRRDNPIWHNYIVEEFHRSATEKDPEKIRKLLRIAEDYTNLIQDVHYEKASDYRMSADLGCSTLIE